MSRKKHIILASDIETSRNYWPFCISFTGLELEPRYYRWDKHGRPGDMLKAKKILADPKIDLVFHNAKYDVRYLRAHGFIVRGKIHDTLLMAKIGSPHRPSYALKALMIDPDLPFNEKCAEYEKIKDLMKQGIWFDEMNPKFMKRYNCNDTLYTIKLFYTFSEVLDEPIYELERKQIPVVIDMEKAGIKVDIEFTRLKLDSFLYEVHKLDRHFKKNYKLDNANSPTQIADLLYNRMKIPPYKDDEGKTHQPTDDLALKIIKRNTKYSIATKLIKHRHLSSQIRFLNQLIKHTTEQGYVFPSFNQMGSEYGRKIKTGRYSSSNPNFQNLPRGSEIRELLVPRKGTHFLDLDYNQIEMRLFAYLAHDEMMIDIYEEGGDLHNEHKKIFVDPFRPDDGTNRQIAKSIGFEILYGIGAPGMWRYLARQNIFIDVDTIKEMLDGWHQLHPSLYRFRNKLHKQLQFQKYVEDLYGRKYYMPIYKSYVATNYYIQGMSANIIKDVMPKVNKYVKQKGGKLLLTIHDELLIELPDRCKKQTHQAIKEIMEEPSEKLHIPLKVEYKVLRKNWGKK